LVLVAPEFVKYVLGDKWLPMVSTFQLMIVYCLFDPLLVTAGNLLTACGAPQKMTRVRLVQLLFFVPAVIAGAAIWQTNGIAIAADGMLVVGLLLVYRLTRPYVDISLGKLFGAPALGLALGGAAVVGLSLLSKNPIAAPGATSYSVQWAIVKGMAFSIPYLAVLLLLEWRDYRTSFQSVDRMFGFSRRVPWSRS
jgi:O-antigen/teichoic acid export membrane protein